MYNFDPYNVLLAISINIPVLLMNAFVLQGHIFDRLINDKYENLLKNLSHSLLHAVCLLIETFFIKLKLF